MALEIGNWAKIVRIAIYLVPVLINLSLIQTKGLLRASCLNDLKELLSMTSSQGVKNLCNNQQESSVEEDQKDQWVEQRTEYSLWKNSMSQTYPRSVMDSKHVRKSLLNRITKIGMAIKMPNIYLTLETMMFYHHIRQRIMRELPNGKTHSMHVSRMVSLSRLSLWESLINQNKIRSRYLQAQKWRFLSWTIVETREEARSKFKSKEETIKKAKEIYKIS